MAYDDGIHCWGLHMNELSVRMLGLENKPIQNAICVEVTSAHSTEVNLDIYIVFFERLGVKFHLI